MISPEIGSVISVIIRKPYPQKKIFAMSFVILPSVLVASIKTK